MLHPRMTRRTGRGRWGTVAAVLVAALTFTACSSSSSPPPSAPTASTAAIPSSTSTTSPTATVPAGRIPISFWMAMSGPLGSDLDHLVNQFNSSQSTYFVQAIYKGTYQETLAATVAAFQAHNAPDIAQIFDVGTATMMDSTGVYIPVQQLMASQNIPFATSDFIGGAASYYETASNQLDSLPFNSSTPVLYYNKAALASINANPPTTWEQVGTVSQELLNHGWKCGFTTGWPDWVQFEQYAVWNGYHYATDNNGYDAIKGVQVEIDTTPFIDHINQFAQWEKSGVFKYDGRQSTADAIFINKTCAMYTDSSATYAAIKKGATFAFGESPLPYDAGAAGAPQNTVVGGASLWVMSSAPKNTLPGVAQFLHFLMSGPSQAYWAENTGYVPVTQAGVAALQSSYYPTHPDALVAVHELNNKPPLPYTRGIRLGDLTQIRDYENAAITAVFGGTETAQQALATAQSQANSLLARFASEYGG